MLQEVQAGDVVRVDGGMEPWRVEARTSDGMLLLESMHAYPRVTWEGVYEFRVRKVGAFS